MKRLFDLFVPACVIDPSPLLIIVIIILKLTAKERHFISRNESDISERLS